MCILEAEFASQIVNAVHGFALSNQATAKGRNFKPQCKEGRLHMEVWVLHEDFASADIDASLVLIVTKASCNILHRYEVCFIQSSCSCI